MPLDPEIAHKLGRRVLPPPERSSSEDNGYRRHQSGQGVKCHGRKLSSVLRGSLTATPRKIVLNFQDIEVLDEVPSQFHAAHSLMLSQNQIHSLAGLHQFKCLTHISLTYNLISDFFELGFLPAHTLRVLALEGNPLFGHPNYRHFVISLFPRLVSLDHKPVTDRDRQDIEDSVTLSEELIPFLCAQKGRLERLQRELRAVRIKKDLYVHAYGVHAVFHHAPMPDLDGICDQLARLQEERGPRLEDTGDETPYIRSRSTPALLQGFVARYMSRTLMEAYWAECAENTTESKQQSEADYATQLQLLLVDSYKSTSKRKYMSAYLQRAQFHIHSGDVEYLANLYNFMRDQQRDIQQVEDELVSAFKWLLEWPGMSKMTSAIQLREEKARAERDAARLAAAQREAEREAEAARIVAERHRRAKRAEEMYREKEQRALRDALRAWRNRTREGLETAQKYHEARVLRQVFDTWRGASLSNQSTTSSWSSHPSDPASPSLRRARRRAAKALLRHRLLSNAFRAWHQAYLSRDTTKSVYSATPPSPYPSLPPATPITDRFGRTAGWDRPGGVHRPGFDALRISTTPRNSPLRYASSAHPATAPGDRLSSAKYTDGGMAGDGKPDDVSDGSDSERGIDDWLAGLGTFGSRGPQRKGRHSRGSYMDHTTSSLLKTSSQHHHYEPNIMHPLPPPKVLLDRYQRMVSRFGHLP